MPRVTASSLVPAQASHQRAGRHGRHAEPREHRSASREMACLVPGLGFYGQRCLGSTAPGVPRDGDDVGVRLDGEVDVVREGGHSGGPDLLLRHDWVVGVREIAPADGGRGRGRERESEAR